MMISTGRKQLLSFGNGLGQWNWSQTGIQKNLCKSEYINMGLGHRIPGPALCFFDGLP